MKTFSEKHVFRIEINLLTSYRLKREIIKERTTTKINDKYFINFRKKLDPLHITV